ncbi:MAG TPA: guanylate kinase [Gemmatimonadaceae bacterium]|jgi:guanylate kinase|nr:guanylate kinase [Gemmatimonadaceae bacterium]
MPFPVILSSPSGGGKTTIAHRLLVERGDVGYSVSCTTRPPREGEVQGKDYHFLTEAEFVSGQKKAEFAESAEVHGHLYGTLRAEVEQVLASGRHVIMDIDVQGARQFAKAFPKSVLIFILPPSADILVERLRMRGTEDSDSLIRRFKSAKDELKAIDLYQYVIVNDEIDSAVAAVSSIINAEGLSRSRNANLGVRVEELMNGIQRAIDQYSARK